MVQESESSPEWYNANRLVPAIVLIAVGGIFLLSNMHLLHARDLWQYWPAAVMVWGVFQLVDAEDARQRTTGGIAFAVGSILLANNLGLIPFNVWNLWPLLIIGVGVYMLVDRSAAPQFETTVNSVENPKRRPGAWTRQETAVFSGGRRRISVEDFRAAKYDCVFGGFEIDLRGSQIQGDSAILEINAVFGGAEVKVPSTWNVVMQGAGVFGGMVDSTEHALPANSPVVKTLYVRGAAVFGGVEIKN